MLKLWRYVCGVFVLSGNHILVLLLSVSFSSQSSLSFTIRAYLCAVSACYCVPVFLLSCTLLIFYSWSVWFLFFPLQDLSFSSSVVLMPLASCLLPTPQPPFPTDSIFGYHSAEKVSKGEARSLLNINFSKIKIVRKNSSLFTHFWALFFPLSLFLFNFLFCSSLTSQIVTVWWQAGWLK